MKPFFIERSFTSYVVFGEDPILAALNKITANQSRLIFVVTESGLLQGVLSDGDFRRWIANCQDIDLNRPVTDAMNPDCVSVSETVSSSEIENLLNDRIIALPLVDSFERLVGVVLPSHSHISFGSRRVGSEEPCFVIAEIGNNHNGSIDTALKLIEAAKDAGADCAKFQMRDMKNLYRNSGKSDDFSSDLGTQYTLDLLERFQLKNDELFRCFEYCNSLGLLPLCTPWDTESLSILDDWGMQGFKIASADFTNFSLISAAAKTGKPLICSTGMASESEIISGIEHLKKINSRYVLLHCNSTYPAPFKDINLRYLNRLRQLSSGDVGYSGHERGIEVSIAAVAMGAVVIEKHITLDREMEGNDHKVSLLPNEFAQMVQGIRRVEKSLGQGGERFITQGEMMNREVLAKSLVADCNIPANTVITEAMVAIRSPGHGLQPNKIHKLVGRSLESNKQKGDFFFQSDLETPAALPREYTFDQPFGLPVRYHDIKVFDSASNLDLLEIHLSYKDLEVDLNSVFSTAISKKLVVHAPELFSGDHTLDLCSLDDSYRERSIIELQRVVDITCTLRPYFSSDDPVLLVTNVGGFSENRHLLEAEMTEPIKRLIDSLSRINLYEKVEIIPQTMPPFPWHFGGQRHHNMFVAPGGIESFCLSTGMRLCLDVSHSRLACNHLKISFRDFLVRILPFTAHLHLADATGVDGEGLQIGQGDIDWVELMQLLRDHAPAASFIPEIWQGHKNSGEGAWLALDLLEKASKIRTSD